MSEPNIHLSEAARAYAEAKAREAGLATADEVVEALVRKAIRREERQKRLEELLLEGLNSGPGKPMTSETWVEMRRLAEKQIAAKKRAREKSRSPSKPTI